MAVKNFVFRHWEKSDWYEENTFLPFLTQPGTKFCTQKAQIRNSLHSILVKKENNYIITNFVTLRLK